MLEIKNELNRWNIEYNNKFDWIFIVIFMLSY